ASARDDSESPDCGLPRSTGEEEDPAFCGDVDWAAAAKPKARAKQTEMLGLRSFIVALEKNSIPCGWKAGQKRTAQVSRAERSGNGMRRKKGVLEGEKGLDILP